MCQCGHRFHIKKHIKTNPYIVILQRHINLCVGETQKQILRKNMIRECIVKNAQTYQCKHRNDYCLQ